MNGRAKTGDRLPGRILAVALVASVALSAVAVVPVGTTSADEPRPSAGTTNADPVAPPGATNADAVAPSGAAGTTTGATGGTVPGGPTRDRSTAGDSAAAGSAGATAAATVEFSYLENISATGANVWTVDSDDQYVYYGAHDGTIYVHEKDRSNGFPLVTTLNPAGNSQVNSVDGDGELIYYGTSGGEVGAYNRDDFSLNWSQSTGSDVMMVDVDDAANATHMVYTVDVDGVYMVEQSTGNVAWSSSNGQDALLDSATIGPQYVYSGNDGDAYVHDHGGNLVYQYNSPDCCKETIVPGPNGYFWVGNESARIGVVDESTGNAEYDLDLSGSMTGYPVSSLYVDPNGDNFYVNDNDNAYIFSGAPSSPTLEATFTIPNGDIDQYDTDSVYADSEYVYFAGDGGNVSVIAKNRVPTADATNGGSSFGGDTSVVEGNTSISFDGTDSSDPDGDSLAYTWTFGDGATGSGSTTTYDYAGAVSTNGGSATYRPDLTVDDGVSTDTDADFATVTVYNDYDGDGKADDDSATGVTTDGDDDDDGVADADDPARFDADADGDGIDDATEGAASDTDTDGDGTTDALDTDSDDDGVPDATEGTTDGDGDGAPAYRDTSPHLTGGASLSTVDEDPSSNPGDSVSSLLSPVFDDGDGGGDSLAGVAIAADASGATNGTWEYSTDGGATWHDVGSVSPGSALLVPVGADLRFSPAAGYNGDPGGLTVYAVDAGGSVTFTDGATRRTFDVTADGVLSPVSPSGRTVEVTVAPVDDPAFARIDAPETVREGRTVTLDGSGSSDADDSSLDYQWNQDHGPGGDLSGSESATATFTAPDVDDPTTVGVALYVGDGDGGDSAFVRVDVLPADDAPTADAGPDRTATAGESVSLDASGSSDPDGDSLSYDWSQTSGPATTLAGADTATPTLTAPDVDRRTTAIFRVTVSDGDESDTDTVSVTVRPAGADNRPPTARTGPDRTVDPGSRVALNATASTDPDGDSLSYRWTQVSGPAATLADADTATPTLTVPDDGTATLTYRVTVSDGDATATATVSLAVAANSTGVIDRFDGDDDGRIDSSELGPAVGAWASGDLSDAQLRTVIEEWVAGD